MNRNDASRACACLAGVAVLCGVGCAPKNNDILHFLRAHEHEVSAIEYRVGIPDGIAISAPSVLEIDGEGARIQPNGKISLRLLGEVKIVGMTAKEIAAKLEVLLGRYYVEPKVAVRVTDYASKKYYVYSAGGGEARPYTGHDTLMDAVMASAADYRVWTSRIKVIRPTADGAPPKIIVVNADEMIRRGDWSKNILLEPDDIVVLPPTPLAWIGLRIRSIIDPVSPILDAYQYPLEVRDSAEIYHADRNGLYQRTGRVRRRSY